MPGFDFYVAGIEDGMIAALKQACPYAKEISAYGGDLDSDRLREALSRLAPRLPLFLVSYGQGEDCESPAQSQLIDSPAADLGQTPSGDIEAFYGVPLLYEHRCTFTVIVCSDDARGEKARRRGVVNAKGLYGMIADVRGALDGIQFWQKPVNADAILLNPMPFKPMAVDYLAKLPDLSAYAIHYESYFKYETADRRVAGLPISEVDFTVQNTDAVSDGFNLPGVTVR